MDGQLTIDSPVTPREKSRTTDPPTSKRAALAAFPRAGAQRHRILVEIAAAPTGLTYDDVALKTGIRGVSVSTRISELHTGGWIEQNGERETSAGAMATVWVATERARVALSGAG